MIFRIVSWVVLSALVGACGVGNKPANSGDPGAGEGVADASPNEAGGSADSKDGIDAQQPDDSPESSDAGGNTAASESQASAQTSGVPTQRPMDSIVKVIQANRHLFRLCYEKVQKEKKELKGDVVINFRITAAGQVVDSQVNQDGTTLKDEDVGSCAANEMKKLTFPALESGMDTEINYPFNFNPK